MYRKLLFVSFVLDIVLFVPIAGVTIAAWCGRLPASVGFYWKSSRPAPPELPLAVAAPVTDERGRWLHGYHINPESRGILVSEYAASPLRRQGLYWGADPGDGLNPEGFTWGSYMMNNWMVSYAEVYKPGISLSMALACILAVNLFLLKQEKRKRQAAFPVVLPPPTA